MNREDFTALLKGLHARELATNQSKGVEYCQGDTQVTANFRRHAKRMGLTPQQVWEVYFSKHWDAVGHYLRTGEVRSETLASRILDMRLYLALLLAMAMEE